MKEVYEFLNNASPFYLTSVNKQQKYIHALSMALLFEDKIYFQTINKKEFLDLLKNNSKFEIWGYNANKWIRINCSLAKNNSNKVKNAFIETYPALKTMFNNHKEEILIYYLKDAIATFYTFNSHTKTIKF